MLLKMVSLWLKICIKVNCAQIVKNPRVIAGGRYRLLLKKNIMEANTNFIEPLLEKAEAYTATSFKLIQLKALDKTAGVTSALLSRSLLTIIISFFALTINIAVALWLGELLGKVYYGFLVVAACYALTAVILLVIQPLIKKSINNAIIKQLFN